MRYITIIAIFALVLFGCEKDKFTTKPQLTYKSVNSTVFEKNQIVRFTLEFTDLEGDLDSLFYKEINPKCEASVVEEGLLLPDFPATKNQKGEIFVSLKYLEDGGYTDILSPRCGFNDTCYFQFYIKDKKNNVSDTVNSETIVFIQP